MVDTIDRLAGEILGHMGVVLISDEEGDVIRVHTTGDVDYVRRYLGGSYGGFPVEVVPSSGIILY